MRMRFWLFVIVTGFAVSGVVRAATFDARQVSADARWVVHVDVDALWASRAAEQFLKPLAALEGVQREREKFRAATGFDVVEGLHGLTLYDNQFKPRQGVVIVHAEVKEAAVAKLLAGQPDFKKTLYAGHTLYSWTDHRHEYAGTLIACVYRESAPAGATSPHGPALFVIAHRRDNMEKALDVLDGKAPSLAETHSPRVAELEDAMGTRGAIVTIGADGLAEASLPFKSPVVRHCQSLNLVAGQQGDEAYVTGRLVAKNEQSAADIERILQGLLALARLSADPDESLQKVLQAVKISVDGKTVTLQWRGQAADVIHAAQEQWIKKQLQQR